MNKILRTTRQADFCRALAGVRSRYLRRQRDWPWVGRLQSSLQRHRAVEPGRRGPRVSSARLTCSWSASPSVVASRRRGQHAGLCGLRRRRAVLGSVRHLYLWSVAVQHRGGGAPRSQRCEIRGQGARSGVVLARPARIGETRRTRGDDRSVVAAPRLHRRRARGWSRDGPRHRYLGRVGRARRSARERGRDPERGGDGRREAVRYLQGV